MWADRQAALAVLASVTLASSCTGVDHDLFEPIGGQAQSGITLSVGEEGVLAPVDLVVDRDGMLQVEDVQPFEGNVDPAVVVVPASGLYRLTPTHALGVLRGSEAASKAEAAMEFNSQPMAVRRGDALAFFLVVQGVGAGTWRADYVRITYRINGAEHQEDIRYSLGVCVTNEAPETYECDAGLPSWWGS